MSCRHHGRDRSRCLSSLLLLCCVLVCRALCTPPCLWRFLVFPPHSPSNTIRRYMPLLATGLSWPSTPTTPLDVDPKLPYLYDCRILDLTKLARPRATDARPDPRRSIPLLPLSSSLRCPLHSYTQTTPFQYLVYLCAPYDAQVLVHWLSYSSVHAPTAMADCICPYVAREFPKCTTH